MQNIAYRVPSVFEIWTTYPDGRVVRNNQPSSSRVITRSQSGYTGKFPKVKPLPIHAYGLSVQDITLNAKAETLFISSGAIERHEGPALSPIVWGVTFTPNPNYGDLYNEALERLTSKVRGDLDLSIDLAEANQTRRMLNLQQQVIDYTRTFVRRFGPLKAAANAWLGYTYGVKPLVQSIYGVADENIRCVINKTARFSARANGKFTPKSAQFKRYNGDIIDMPVVNSNIKLSVTIGLDMRTDAFDLARWTSMNPASIAWELLPLSFVADWFWNLGGYLRNLETYCYYGGKFRSGYRTNLMTGGLTTRIYAQSATSTARNTTEYVGKLQTTGIERIVLSEYPAPTLPSFGAQLGSSRLLSGAALLAQLLDRR